jgi:hypothetical protein
MLPVSIFEDNVKFRFVERQLLVMSLDKQTRLSLYMSRQPIDWSQESLVLQRTDHSVLSYRRSANSKL